MMTIIVQALILLFAYATSWFVISVLKKRNDVADIAWGLGYCLLCLYMICFQSLSSSAILVCCLVIIWGIRLSVHIYLRNRNKSEDFRYKQWRDEWGSNFYWRSYLQVYLLQACILLIVASSVLIASSTHENISNEFTIIGMGIWLFGFLYESIADYQLSLFVKNKRSKEEIIQTGLWKYSRHPNYFGEIVVWWGIFVMVIPYEYGFYALISPVTITLLLVFVSGIPMLEKKYKGNFNYEKYKLNTPALIPKFW